MCVGQATTTCKGPMLVRSLLKSEPTVLPDLNQVGTARDLVAVHFAAKLRQRSAEAEKLAPEVEDHDVLRVRARDRHVSEHRGLA